MQEKKLFHSRPVILVRLTCQNVQVYRFCLVSDQLQPTMANIIELTYVADGAKTESETQERTATQKV